MACTNVRWMRGNSSQVNRRHQKRRWKYVMCCRPPRNSWNNLTACCWNTCRSLDCSASTLLFIPNLGSGLHWRSMARTTTISTPPIYKPPQVASPLHRRHMAVKLPALGLLPNPGVQALIQMKFREAGMKLGGGLRTSQALARDWFRPQCVGST